MARYIDKVIKGEQNFAAFMDRFEPDWRSCERIENIWRFNKCRVERFYEKGPQDEYYKEWFWLTMESNHPDKGFTDGQFSERRSEIYEGIRTGRITGQL